MENLFYAIFEQQEELVFIYMNKSLFTFEYTSILWTLR